MKYNLCLNGGGFRSFIINWILFDYLSNSCNNEEYNTNDYYAFLNNNFNKISTNSGGCWLINSINENRIEKNNQLEYIEKFIDKLETEQKSIIGDKFNTWSDLLNKLIWTDLKDLNIVEKLKWNEFINKIQDIYKPIHTNKVLDLDWIILNNICTDGINNNNTVYYLTIKNEKKKMPYLLNYYSIINKKKVVDIKLPYLEEKNILEYNLIDENRNINKIMITKDKIKTKIADYTEKYKDVNTSCILGILSAYNKNLTSRRFFLDHMLDMLFHSYFDINYVLMLSTVIGLVAGILIGGFTSRKNGNGFGFGSGLGIIAGLVLGSILPKNSSKLFRKLFKSCVAKSLHTCFNCNVAAQIYLDDNIKVNGVDGGYTDNYSIVPMVKILIDEKEEDKNFNKNKDKLFILAFTNLGYKDSNNVPKSFEQLYDNNINTLVDLLKNNYDSKKIIGDTFKIFNLINKKIGKPIQKDNVWIRIDEFKFKTINNNAYKIKEGYTVNLKLVNISFINLGLLLNKLNKNEYENYALNLKSILIDNNFKDLLGIDFK